MPRKQVFREDYRRKPCWSYLEAMDYSGYAYNTIARLIHFGKVRVGNARGPLRVDAMSFMSYIKTGDGEVKHAS